MRGGIPNRRSATLWVSFTLCAAVGCPGDARRADDPLNAGDEPAPTGRAEATGSPPSAAAPEQPPLIAASRWLAPRAPQDPVLLTAAATVRAQQAVGEVGLAFAGRVVALHTSPGARVTAGEQVAEMVVPEVLDAAARYPALRQGAAQGQARVEVLTGLVEEGLATRADLVAAQEGARQLGIERDRAQGTLRAAGVDPAQAAEVSRRGTVVLRAPISGVVVSIAVHLGQSLAPGEPLAQLVGEGPAKVEVQLAAPPGDAQSVLFEGTDGRTIPLGAEPVATVMDPSTGTWRAWYEPAPDLLLPDGLTGTVRFEVREGVWELPRAAVMREGASTVILRRREGDATAERVPVRVVGTAGAAVLVTGDLTKSDRVAARYDDADPGNDGPQDVQPSGGEAP